MLVNWKQKSDFSSACFEFIHGMFLIVVVPLYSPPFVLQLDQDFETSLQKPTRKNFP